jgi:hypothetical protein
MNPTTLNLTVRAGHYRGVGSSCAFAAHHFHVMLALMASHTLPCKVYSPTNVVFDVDEKTLNRLWAEVDRERFWFINDSDLKTCKEVYVTGWEDTKPCVMLVPNLFIKETPFEIKEIINGLC